jgi:hypothetical protein
MISVKDNIREVMSFTERLGSQYRFAVAKALTDTAREVAREDLPQQAEKDLDNPTPFTKSGFFFTPARKDSLTAVVGAKDRQSSYLHYQVRGGTRRPKRKALRLPSEVELNQFGNMPRGLVAQLIRRAREGKRATKSQSAKFGVSQKVDLFYGDPGDDRPPGIYKRVPLPGDRNRLVPIVVFPSQPAQYKPRLDFAGAVQRAVRSRFVPNLRRATALARATAR